MRCRNLVLAILVATAPCPLALGQEPQSTGPQQPATSVGTSASTRRDRADAAALEAAPRPGNLPGVAAPVSVLLLTSGRVLEGQMMPHAAGYLVRQAAGEVLVPNDQVRCAASNLRELYRFQRKNVLDPTAQFHIELAGWCVAYHLPHEARDELLTALRLEPENEAAQRMLTRVEDELRPKTATIERAPRNADGFLVPKVESLGGLSKATATQFTQQIQPLLSNRCGGGNCHGSRTTSEFRLERVRLDQPGGRPLTERNLAQVLGQIRLEDWSHSPLLEVLADSNHGGTGKTLFGSLNEASQKKLLREWVRTVAEERHAEAEEIAARASLPRKKSSQKRPARGSQPEVVPASSSSSSLAPGELAVDANPIEFAGGPDPLAGNRGGFSVADDFANVADVALEPGPAVEPVPVEPVPADPFDPEVFNRQAGSPPSSGRDTPRVKR